MAHRTEKEDVPKTTTLKPCINNMSLTTTNNNNDSTTSSSSSISQPLGFGSKARTTSTAEMIRRESVVMESEMKKPAVTNRCSGCMRKVGLTGFRCRCGDLFCSVHRYSDRHDCSYDYKAAGKAAIARENPIVKSAKIVRI